MNYVAATVAMRVNNPTPFVTDRNTFDVNSNLWLDVGLWASAEFGPTLIDVRQMQAPAHGKARYFPRSICLGPLRSGTPCCSSKHIAPTHPKGARS